MLTDAEVVWRHKQFYTTWNCRNLHSDSKIWKKLSANHKTKNDTKLYFKGKTQRCYKIFITICYICHFEFIRDILRAQSKI